MTNPPKAANALRFKVILPGDPAPTFHQRSTSNEKYAFDTAAGRYLVLCFYGSAADVWGRKMLTLVMEHRGMFDDERFAFFGVSHDSRDETQGRVKELLPGVRFFWDFDGLIGRLYGSLPQDTPVQQVTKMRQMWVVLDPNLRVREVIGGKDAFDIPAVAARLAALPPVDQAIGITVQAPVLHLPRVFEPELCAQLIEFYERHGGEDSGFMTEKEGLTTLKVDYGHKRRSDCMIDDEALKSALQARVNRRIVPEIKKVHQFTVTRMERYLIGCYMAETGGHFRPHRDNTTKGTAHRRFAVSINLNSDFDGGELRFPEYGSQTYKPAPGAAVVFSCSLLHMVTPVTRGRRFAFLPFLYDDAAAAIREQNNAFLGEGTTPYKQDTGQTR
jgi:predicted 2-oxoglutarate/Fe(II)-dependent dioxygenase YbiX/peroxiredoxin